MLSKPTQQYKKNQLRICKKLFDDYSETSTSDSDSLPFSPVALVSGHKSLPSTAKKIVDISSDDDSIFSHANTSIPTPISPRSIARIKCSSRKQAKRIISKEDKNSSLNLSLGHRSDFRNSQSNDTGCVVSRYHKSSGYHTSTRYLGGRPKYHSEFDSDSSNDQNFSHRIVARLDHMVLSEGSNSLRTLSLKSRDQDLKLAKSKSIEVESDTECVPAPEINHSQEDKLPAVRHFPILPLACFDDALTLLARNLSRTGTCSSRR